MESNICPSPLIRATEVGHRLSISLFTDLRTIAQLRSAPLVGSGIARHRATARIAASRLLTAWNTLAVLRPTAKHLNASSISGTAAVNLAETSPPNGSVLEGFGVVAGFLCA